MAAPRLPYGAHGMNSPSRCMYVWEDASGDWVGWDGSVVIPPITVGTVDQGAAGADPWLVTGDWLTDAELRATPIDVVVTGGGGGGTASLFGDPFPTSGTAAGFLDSTGDMAPVELTAAGELPIAFLTTPTINLGTIAGIATETTLAAINTKTPALGQALAAASVPVVLPAAQITTLTPQTDALTDAQLRATPVPVTANAGTNLNTSLLALEAGGNLAAAAASLAVMDDWDESDRAKVNPIVGQAGVAAGAGAVSDTVQRTTLASDDPAVAVLGAITGAAVITDANGTIQQYLRGLVKLAITAGGWLVTATLAAGTALIGKVSASNETSTIYDGATPLTPKFAIIDAATSGDNTLIAAVNPKKIRVLGGMLIAAGTVTARFESGASGTALTGQMNLVANMGFQIPYIPVGNFETASNTLLNLELSAAISVDGWLVYVEV